jgi:hypothetical protein
MGTGCVYLRHTAGKSNYIQVHHCWNMTLFVASQMDICHKMNAEAKKKDKVSIELVGRKDYDAARFGKKR